MDFPEIMVFVKEVPDTHDISINPETGTLRREGNATMLNPDDEVAIEAALKLKQIMHARLTAISMGPKKTLGLVKYLTALGFDRGILLSDPAFSGSDTLATSQILSSAVKFLGLPALLLFGAQSADGDTGQVPGQTAELLNLPSASLIKSLSWDSDTLFVTQELIPDEIRHLEIPLPAALSFLPRSEPSLRFPSAARFFQPQPYEILDLKNFPNLSPNDIGLKGSPTRVIQVSAPDLRKRTAEVAIFSQNWLKKIAAQIKKI